MVAIDWDVAWLQALEALEVDVATAERTLAVNHLPSVDEIAVLAAWQVPAGLGPLPAALVDRARALLDRQLVAATAIGRAMTMNRRHLAAIGAMNPVPASRPVYVDVEG